MVWTVIGVSCVFVIVVIEGVEEYTTTRQSSLANVR